MLVTIGNWNVCDGTRLNGVSLTGLKFRVEREIQVQKIFRATDVTTFDRGNRKTTATFVVIRTFPDLESAETYILEHESIYVPQSGIVSFTSQKPNGQKVTIYLTDGKVQSHECIEQNGVTTHHQYVIVGGAITSTQPSS